MKDNIKNLNDAINDLNKEGLTNSEMDFALGAQFAIHYIMGCHHPFADGGNTMAGKLKTQLNK